MLNYAQVQGKPYILQSLTGLKPAEFEQLLESFDGGRGRRKTMWMRGWKQRVGCITFVLPIVNSKLLKSEVDGVTICNGFESSPISDNV